MKVPHLGFLSFKPYKNPGGDYKASFATITVMAIVNLPPPPNVVPPLRNKGLYN